MPDHQTTSPGPQQTTETEPSEPAADQGHDALRLLREEVSHLVKTVPGPVTSVSARLGECVLEVTWAARQTVTATTEPLQVAAPVPVVVPVGEAPAAPVDERVKEVVAPLVGTFYVAPEPGAPPFVQVGDRVEAGQTVGIVEAMKLMNPVVSDWPGEVVEVVVANAEPVEFAQALVRIRIEDDEPADAS